MQELSPANVRYIKLGEGGRWEEAALQGGELHLGHSRVPHDLALAGNRDAIIRHLTGIGRAAQAATEDAREVLDFYQLGSDCLWITFARDRLWWAFAEPSVEWRGGDGERAGQRVRKTLNGWQSADVMGHVLLKNQLSTKLTQLEAYRRTVCRVAAQDYLLDRLNGRFNPIAEEANRIRDAMAHVMVKAIASLHWKDFETLVDLIFARSGWSRVSALGGDQKFVDIELEQATTGERAAVQVKSRATQAVLDDYVKEFEQQSTSFTRLFFVCHSPTGVLASPGGTIHVLAGVELAGTVLKLGLHDWVIQKIA
jgi:hypothetical protein